MKVFRGRAEEGRGKNQQVLCLFAKRPHYTVLTDGIPRDADHVTPFSHPRCSVRCALCVWTAQRPHLVQIQPAFPAAAEGNARCSTLVPTLFFKQQASAGMDTAKIFAWISVWGNDAQTQVGRLRFWVAVYKMIPNQARTHRHEIAEVAFQGGLIAFAAALLCLRCVRHLTHT